MLRRIREHELEAQLSPRDAEQDVHRKSVAKLKSETRITDRELERVTAKQKQNEHDRSYWPNRAAYRKPTASPIEPMVETPVRTSTPTFNNR